MKVQAGSPGGASAQLVGSCSHYPCMESRYEDQKKVQAKHIPNDLKITTSRID